MSKNKKDVMDQILENDRMAENLEDQNQNNNVQNNNPEQMNQSNTNGMQNNNNNNTNQSFQNNNWNNYNNSNINNKKSNLPIILLIVGIVVVAIIIIVAIIFILKENLSSSNYNHYDYERIMEIETSLNENFEVKHYPLENGSILIELDNKNDYGVVADYKIKLLDENNNIIDIQKETEYAIAPKAKGYKEVYIENKEAKNFEVEAELSLNQISKSYNDDIKIISTKDTAREVTIEYQNNSKKKLDYIEIGIIFYDDNNQIVGYSSGIEAKVKSGKVKKMDAFIPFNNDYTEKLKYTKYETVIVEAIQYTS